MAAQIRQLKLKIEFTINVKLIKITINDFNQNYQSEKELFRE